jgi:sulfate/thiosulfate transport system permease protein
MAIRADTPDIALKAPPAPTGRRRFRVRPLSLIGMTAGGTLLVGYLSVIVLIPIAALAAHGLGISIHTHSQGFAFWNWTITTNFSGFWQAVTAPDALSAIWLSLWLSLSVAAINAVAGIAIAWVLVRDEFPGKRIMEAVIDLPFALPTIVAGVVFLVLYGDASPIHVNLFETWAGLLVALLFVTLPFSVRSIQPVLQSLEGNTSEAAARTLGAGKIRTFWNVVLPSLLPAVLSGFGLAFARAVGEFGSIDLISGGLGRTTTASILIYRLMGSFYTQGQAAAVSVALLVISLLLLGTSAAGARRVSRRLSA